MPCLTACPITRSLAGEFATRLISFAADSADLPGINDYDGFAEAYTASNDNNLVNAYYERPAMLALAGAVAGRRISRRLWFRSSVRGPARPASIVLGIDKSAEMVVLARRRLGADADLRVAELGSPLPFSDDTFDDVTASLVLHYLEDWRPALVELRRVLKLGGRLIVSCQPPFLREPVAPRGPSQPDYFATYNYVVEWTADGRTALLRFWTRRYMR